MPRAQVTFQFLILEQLRQLSKVSLMWEKDKIDWNSLISLFSILNQDSLEIEFASSYVGKSWEEKLQIFDGQNPNDQDSARNRIISFFEQLKEEVHSKIEEKEKNALRLAEELEDRHNKVREKCKLLCKQEQLYTLITNNLDNEQNFNKELKIFFSEQQSKIQENVQQFEELFNNYQELYNSYNPLFPDKVKKEIFSYLDQVDFFNINKQLFIKDSDDLKIKAVNYLAHETERISQIVQSINDLFQKNILTQKAFNEAKIGQFQEKIVQDVSVVYEEKKKILEKLIKEFPFTNAMIEELTIIPLSLKSDIILKIMQSLSVVSAIEIIQIVPQEIKFDLIKSNVKQSQYAIIEKSDRGLLSLKANGNNFTVYTDFILDPNLKYVAQFKIISSSPQGYYGYQYIGLTREENKSNYAVNSQNLLFCSNSAYTLTKHVKGQQTFQTLFSGITDFRIQIQICLKDKLFRVIDLPKKSVVYELSDGAISDQAQYRLGMDIIYQGDMITIESLSTVEKFPSY